MIGNPWIAVAIVIGVLLICAWIGWAIHVSSEHGGREALGVLIVWPAIVAVLAVIAILFVWAFPVIRASACTRDQEPGAEAEPESADAEVTETG